MAYSYNVTTASGSSQNVAVPFPYLSEADVHVTVDGVQVADADRVWLTPSSIQLPTMPTAGQVLKVYRLTPGADLGTVFDDPSVLSPPDIMKNMRQALYVAQEAYDIGGSATDDLSALITNLNASVAAAGESAEAAASSLSSIGNALAQAQEARDAAAASAALAASYSGESQAPTDADYLTKTANGVLSAGRVVTDNTNITWDWSTAGIVKAVLAAGSVAASHITDATITLAKLAAACFATEAEAEAGEENTKIVTTLRVWQAIAAYLAANPQTARTGTVRPTHQLTPDTGWIAWDDGTIGNAASGASNRANADTSALFNLYYTWTDALCPLFTSDGTPTTRAVQGSAATAYAANCRVRLPAGAGRFVGVKGSGSGLTARATGDKVGAETQTLSTANLPAHTHDYEDGQGTITGSFNDGGSGGNGFSGSSDTARTTGSTGSGTALSIMNPGTYLLHEIKL